MTSQHIVAVAMLTASVVAAQPPVVGFPVTYPLDYNGRYLQERDADDIVTFIRTVPHVDHRVRLISRQDDCFPLPQLEIFACYLDVSLTIGDYHQRIERRCMFAETFTYVECEHCNRAALVLQQHTANDGAILILQ